MSHREQELLRWLRREGRGWGGELLGDDAALLPAGGPWAVTVDTQIEGVHFLPGTSEARVARRLLAVNLSDLAAVGALPRYAFLSLSAPAGFEHRRFFRALGEACQASGVKLAGGDLSSSRQCVFVLTLVGSRRPGSRWLERRLARPGDRLWCGGTVGESALGRLLLAAGATLSEGGRMRLPPDFPAHTELRRAARRALERHLAPQAQLALSAWLARRRRVAAIDLSDGLAIDLARLTEESAVGARLHSLPVEAELGSLAQWLGRSPEELALHGGEDYVLLFTLPPGQRPPGEFGCREIGEITRARELLLLRDGKQEKLAAEGWDHLALQQPGGENRKPPPRGSERAFVTRRKPAG
ncbi:MAG: thiamine-phosphate kinase [Thermoanaerobaculia bacterium]